MTPSDFKKFTILWVNEEKFIRITNCTNRGYNTRYVNVFESGNERLQILEFVPYFVRKQIRLVSAVSIFLLQTELKLCKLQEYYSS